MKNFILVFIICSTLHIACFAQTQALPASEVIAKAKAASLKENKKIFVIFHASWCVWCHRMDSALNTRG